MIAVMFSTVKELSTLLYLQLAAFAFAVVLSVGIDREDFNLFLVIAATSLMTGSIVGFVCTSYWIYRQKKEHDGGLH